MSRIAVIGDIGGQFAALAKELKRLGADSNLVLPDDLIVVQIGDVVHRGPESDLVVSYINEQLAKPTPQWIQLLGNHECYYFAVPKIFEWEEEISEQSQLIVQSWWEERKAAFATALVDENDNHYLITHAGITSSFWDRRLGKPEKAVDAASKINKMGEYSLDTLLQPGVMVEGFGPNPLVGPIWAEATREINPGWAELDAMVPFHQIHGHSSSFDWEKGEWLPSYQGSKDIILDAAAKHIFVEVGDKKIIEIDPGHKDIPQAEWQALVFKNARIDLPVTE